MANYLPRLWQTGYLFATRFDSIRNLLLIAFTLFHVAGFAATKTSAKNGNWGDPTVWSPAGIPAITDLVVIKGGHTITVNGAYTCADLQIGNTVASNATLRITASGNSLTINGALAINPNNNNNTYTLEAGPGVINVAGTFATWSSTGTNRIRVGTGAINFTPAITLSAAAHSITYTAAGNINFLGGFTDNVGKLVPFTGCTAKFYNHYTAGARMNWNGKGTAVFKGNTSISSSASLIFNAVTIDTAANVTLAAGTDSILVKGVLTLSYSSAFSTMRNLELASNWVNNGGTYNANGNTVIFSGTAPTIGGTTSTAFGPLQFGTSASTVSCTANSNCSATSVVFNANTKSRTLLLGSGVAFSVSGNVTINQPTADNLTCGFSIGSGTLNINGDLIFVGTSATTTRKVQVVGTSGTFNLTGGITWMSNTSSATELISTATGAINFASPITMGSASGTIKVTGAGILNFNSTSSPSFIFGGSTAPSLNTVAGSTVSFKAGFSASTTSLTFAAGSTVQFTGNSTVAPTSAVTFGNVLINSGVTLTAAGNIAVKNNWTNLGTFVPSTYIVTFNGSGTQAISKVGGETFYKLTLSTANAILSVYDDLTITNTLTMGGHNIALNDRTLVLGNSAAAALSRSRGIVYGGIFKRWFPASAITSTNGSYYGLFPIGTATAYRPVAINTSGNPTTAGYVMASCSDANTVTQVSYTDNEGANIQTIANSMANISTSGIAGGTYKLNVTYSNLGRNGVISDLKLETYTGSTMGSYGATQATSGTLDTPTVKRINLTLAQLANTWVVGTKNATATPIRQFYYARQTGNWNDGNIWSYTDGGASCGCQPSTDGYVVIGSGNTVTVNTNATVDFMEIKNGATLTDDGSKGLTVNFNMLTQGTGKFNNTSTWAINGNVVLSATSVASVGAALSVAGSFTVPANATLNLQAGTLTLNGDVTINGSVNMLGGALALNSVGGNISGIGNILGNNGETVSISNAKTLTSGTSLSFGTVFSSINLSVSAGATITNNATIALYGNLIGGSAATTWVNGPSSVLGITGTLLANGVLNTSTGANTVKYLGAAQDVKVPNGSYYALEIAGTGAKALTATVDVDNMLTVKRGGTLNAGTYAVTGTGGLVMEEGSEYLMQRSVAGVYPELQGSYNLNYGTITINQTANTTILAPAAYYNIKLTGTQPCDISGVELIKGSLLIQNAASITGNDVMHINGTLNLTSSAVSTLGNDIYVGGINIASGGLNDGSHTITLTSGNWVNNSSTNALSGLVIFGGASAQTVGGSQATKFYNLSMRNKAGVTLALAPAAPTVITNDLLLDSGIIFTTAQNILKLVDTATASSGNAISYIDGPMVKVGNGDFVFPIGKAGKWRRTGISNMQNNNTEVTAEYFAQSYPDIESMDANLAVVSNMEYWDIHRSVTNDSLKLTLFWEDASQSTVHSCENLTIAHFKNGQWMEENAVASNSSICQGTGAGSITTTGFVTSFSPFGFGDNGSGSALPVKLLTFTADVVEKDVDVKWATALELNNSHFEVERSANGLDFEKVGEVKGAGNSTVTLSYNFLDKQPLSGISYYRLRQVDYDGAFEYSPIASVNVAGPTSTVSMCPNPARNQVSITAANVQGQIDIAIYNQTGVLVHSQQVSASNNYGRCNINTAHLPSGMYFVTLHGGNTDTTQKLVIE